MDIINAIACGNRSDTTHHIHFLRDGLIQAMTLAEFEHQAVNLAWYLHDFGLRQGDRIGIMAKNSLEWALLDLATLKLGGVVAGFEANRYDASTLMERYALKLLLLDKNSSSDPHMCEVSTIRKWAEKEVQRADYPALHTGYGATDIAAIKFTSGSTGDPKGLEATVGSINDSISSVQQMFNHHDGDNIFVFLPLSLLQQRYWIYSALVYGHDVTLTTLDYAFPLAQSVRPTVIMGVPGFFDAIVTQIDKMSQIVNTDLVGRRSAIQSLLGDRIRYLWTGSAPCSRTTLNYFNDCGTSLFEGYGMNETCIVSKNYPGAYRLGSVGKVLPNKNVRFDEDGVLVIGSPNPVNTHYSWCGPGDNDRIFLPNGDVRTGDLGYLDEDGYLYIQGRADDIVALSNGRNINVRPIEESIKSHVEVHECVLYGSGKAFLTALVSPAEQDVDKASIQNHIHELNRILPQEQQVRGLVMASECFSIENHLLTSQFKPKRKEIYRRFSTEIEQVYGG